MNRWIAALALILAALAPVHSTGAAGSATVAFAPEHATVDVGATVDVDVTVANIDPSPGLAGYDLTLTFDPSLVRLETLTDTGFVSNQGNVVICVPGEIDNVAGSVNPTCTVVPLGAAGVSTTDPVPILHATFTGLSAGASSLAVSGSLFGPTGTTIPVSFSAGQVSVRGAPQATSTIAAATPTDTPRSGVTPSPVPIATSTPAGAAPAVASPAAPDSPTAVATKLSVPATGDGGNRASGDGNLTVVLTVVAAAAAIAGSIFLTRWLRRRTHT